jgi:hypothetical protein
MGECVLTRRSVVKNEYIELADITVGTATTNVDIPGLNLVKGEEYVLVSSVIAVGDTVYRIYFNNNLTNTNYYRQGLKATSTTVSADRANTTTLFDNFSSINNTKIKLTNSGYGIWQNDATKDFGGSGILLHNLYGTSTFTMTSITQITIKSDAANYIGVGSRFTLYKVGA